MTESENRATYFSEWRTALRNLDFTACEDNMNFLLTSIDNHSPSWESLVSRYNSSFQVLLDELQEITEHYNKDKRLSKGLQAIPLQSEKRRLFWLSMYDIFYQEFKRKSLLPEAK